MLREARERLSDAQYVALNKDLRILLRWGPLG